jgi:inner membrane protein
MDIVTHAVSGAVLASPFVGTHPIAAGAFALATTLPDLDSLSRLFGKRAFLRHHQTWSHSLAFAVGAGVAAGVVGMATGVREPFLAVAVFAGFVAHSLFDLTNTYGIALLSPVFRRRFSLDWFFFIDLPVTAISFAALAWVILDWRDGAGPGWGPAAVWLTAMVIHLTVKLLFRRRAIADSPEGTLSLLPSIFLPWWFIGCSKERDFIRTFRLDAVTGRMDEVKKYRFIDEDYRALLEAVPEFRVMSSLTPAYHLVRAEPVNGGTELVCRDLRTRHFGARFGELTLLVGDDGNVRRKVFRA